MKFHVPFAAQPICSLALMIASVLLIVGCSSSSEPAANEQLASEPAVSEPVSNEPAVSDPIESDAPSTEEMSDSGGDETTDIDPEVIDPVVVDPQIQNNILVTFEITVPFYMSDELRVELVWGDINLNAMWVGGQFWSASGELPTETENPLIITFFDKNGDIELAEYSQIYKTTSNVSEAVQIQAEQFDASLFDYDGDKVNNLDELSAGTDPFVDEDSQLEIEDFYSLSDPSGVFSRLSVSESYESRVSDVRPYMGTFDSDPDWGELLSRELPVSGEIDIDADGNGTLTMQAGESRPQLSLTGTRTHSGSSISWVGVRREWGSDYFHEETVSNTVTIIDENVRSFVEDIAGSNTGTFEYSWETSANLTGVLIEGSSLCKPDSGTFTATQWTSSVRGQYDSKVDIAITKNTEDRYWRVKVVEDDILGGSISSSEYFVRELRIQQRTDVADSAFFICDFADI